MSTTSLLTIVCVSVLVSCGQGSSLKFNSVQDDISIGQRLNSLEKKIGEVVTENRRLQSQVQNLKQELSVQRNAEHLNDGVSSTITPPLGFSAGLSARNVSGLFQGQVIKFDEVFTNVGHAYEPELGTFTALYSGLYFFNMAMMLDPGQDGDLHLAVNNNDLAYMYVDTRTSQTLGTTSRSVTLSLVKGDRVTIKNAFDGPRSLHGHRFTTFSGFLIVAYV